MSPMTREEAEREAVRRWGPRAMAWCRGPVVFHAECVVGIGGAHAFAIGTYCTYGKGRTFEAAFKNAESRGYRGMCC